MGAKTVFFDFDETLVDTSELRPYRQTAEGRRFIADHPDQVPTRLADPDLLNLFNGLAQKKLVAIATNSAQDYTKALLSKHGFSTDIPIYYNLHKPCRDDLSNAIQIHCTEAANALYVGDSASDIIAAHGCRIPSVAVTWGKTSTTEMLHMAEPNITVNNTNELIKAIRLFWNNDLEYKERSAPEGYFFLNNLPEEININCKSMHPYYPTGHHLFYSSYSNEILRFKDMKDFTKKEINCKASGNYFYGGGIRPGLVLLSVFHQFYQQLAAFIGSLNLSGKTYVLAAPNSAPEYCYKFDVNQIMANLLNQNIFNIDSGFQKRILYRIFPKRESHLNGTRSELEHYKTIGIRRDERIPGELNNLLIFDDITTTGGQLRSLAGLMKTIFRFDGNIIGITLGQTSS